jgi:hypothetical protein
VELRYLDPGRLRPVNRAFNEEHKQRLAADMKEHGWRGRGILVEESKRFPHPEFYAWTGSHRIEAAKLAGLATVPCHVITAEEAMAAFGKNPNYDFHGHGHWRGAIIEGGRRDLQQEWRRLAALEDAGLEEAAQMLRDEIAATDGVHGR